MDQFPEFFDDIPDRHPFTLRGRAQHEIAHLALSSTGTNTELADHIQETLRAHDFIGADISKNAFGLNSSYDEATGALAKTDIIFSLMIMAEYPEIPENSEAARLMIDTLLSPMPEN